MGIVNSANVKKQIKAHFRNDIILYHDAEGVIPAMIKKMEHSFWDAYGAGFTLADNPSIITQAVKESIKEYGEFLELIERYKDAPEIYKIKNTIEKLRDRMKEVLTTLQ